MQSFPSLNLKSSHGVDETFDDLGVRDCNAVVIGPWVMVIRISIGD